MLRLSCIASLPCSSSDHRPMPLGAPSCLSLLCSSTVCSSTDCMQLPSARSCRHASERGGRGRLCADRHNVALVASPARAERVVEAVQAATRATSDLPAGSTCVGPGRLEGRRLAAAVRLTRMRGSEAGSAPRSKPPCGLLSSPLARLACCLLTDHHHPLRPTSYSLLPTPPSRYL